MDLFFTDDTRAFQDDNASIHQAQIMKRWFREHEASLSHVDWPPQHPDLNPAEKPRAEVRLSHPHTTSWSKRKNERNAGRK